MSATDTAALLNHRSVRSYSDRPLPAGTLETLVIAAEALGLGTVSIGALRNDLHGRERIGKVLNDQRLALR